MHAFNLNTQEAEAGGALQVQVFWVYLEFQASLGYIEFLDT